MGFRPHLRRLASDLGLTGVVVNDGDGVWCEVQGRPLVVDRFVAEFANRAPPLARIREQSVSELAPSATESAFVIAASVSRSGQSVGSVPPDVAPCSACRDELFDPGNRRYGYAFLCCTDCGPRFTVIRGMPYDRARTAMAPFVLCERCESEYSDPDDRRFHAQATCCADCGPRLRLRSSKGQRVESADPVADVVAALIDGRIVAVKGLGGYQLMCRADDDAVVSRLRQSKQREEKPFALLCLDLAHAEAVVELSDLDRRALVDPAAPIVLARRRRAPTMAVAKVAPLVAPDTELLGVMLSSSPLHLLISAAFGSTLVCTSGNVSDEPIVIDDDRVVTELGGIADMILGHDRVIERRADDSVGRVMHHDFQILRRARGLAPRPVRLPDGLDRGPVVLAVGAHLKNTVGVAAGPDAQLSVHLGDLDHPRAIEAFERTIADLLSIVGVEPDVVVHDLHPEYTSTKFALAADLAPTMGVQHHHAHLASCLADNASAETGSDSPILGVIFDGLGWGPDGTLWGGEFLLGDAGRYERVAHLQPVVMPGGEAAIQHPWRMAVAHLVAAGVDIAPIQSQIEDAARAAALVDVIRRGDGPLTSSVGRLFDAVAALCGVSGGRRAAYEGQAAIQLEQLATMAVSERAARDPVGQDRRYTVAMLDPVESAVQPHKEPHVQLDPAPMFTELVDDLRRGIEPAVVAARFHRWVAEMITTTTRNLRHHGYDTVALTGGVFQNRLLTEMAHGSLTAEGFTVLTHHQVPPNDGGISLGQLAVARANATTTGSSGI